MNVQMLSELEEVIQYKLVPERRETIRTMWWDRLQVWTRHWLKVVGFNSFSGPSCVGLPCSIVEVMRNGSLSHFV